jgi:hypothetical protein
MAGPTLERDYLDVKQAPSQTFPPEDQSVIHIAPLQARPQPFDADLATPTLPSCNRGREARTLSECDF